MWLTAQAREEALSRFERVTAWPMLLLALAIIPIIITPFVVDLSPATSQALTAADWLIWAMFALEFIIRITLAGRKWHFLKHNVIDAAVVILPMAQPLRILRSVRVLRALRVARAGVYLGRGVKEGRTLFSRENFSYAMAVTVMAIGGASLIIWAVERDAPSGNIHTFPDAVWWAITTIATVGYGDKFPVTPEGRAIAIVLMALGIGLFGLIAATLSSFFVEQQHQGQFDLLLERMDSLEQKIDALGSTGKEQASDSPRTRDTGTETSGTPADS
jgi:voltage-gated potassium channel